jgi:hypothetical protein
MVKSEPKAFYGYVRSKAKAKVKVGPLKDEKGQVVCDNGQMCEILNEYFATVFVREDLSNVPNPKLNLLDDNKILDDLVIDKRVLLQKLLQLKDDKAPGNDGFSPFFIKRIAEEIVDPLCMIFRSSLDESDVPDDWKVANVSPIFKKGKKDDPGNYRPVSLTSVISKIFESLMRDSIMGFLKDILSSQHGFTPKKSCLTNLIEFSDFVSNNLDNNEPVNVIYLDFRKAFDTVPHEIIENLKQLAFGVRSRHGLKVGYVSVSNVLSCVVINLIGRRC